VQAIRSYVRDREPQQVSSEMGAGAADIAEIVSDVKEVLPNLPPPPTLEPDAARFRLFDSVTAFLKSAGRRQPLVLILEDLHWADTPSLLLLEFVARELSNERLMVIGTYRDVEVNRRTPLGRTLGELTRERLYQRILLRGLTQDDVARFMELASGVVPTQGMVEAVYRQTEGNPLFVTEVVRLLVQEGQIEHRDAATQRDSGTWALRIPEGIREVIGRRLERLSERCNQTLTIASIIGREFELRQLADLVEDMSEDRLLEVLEEALAARVIEELPRSVGRYQFTHALIQNTLNEELSATRRARLHARIAQVLEQMYENSIEAHASELAYHFAEAAVVIGTEKLVRYSGMAGERALAAYAWEEASEHFERALAAKEGQMPSAEPGHIADGETAALLYGLGRAQLTMLHVEEGWSNLTRAFDYYAAVKDIRRVADIAEYPVSVTATGSIAPLLARALELVPPDSYEAGRLLAWHGRLLNILQGDYEGAKDALSRALAITRREGDVALEMQALAFCADVEGIQLHYEQSLEKALQAIELIPHADNPLAEMFAHMYAALVLASTGSANDVVEQHGAAALAASSAWWRWR
jgi:tetratricopeptide (TPR) repeat protein